MAEIVTMPKLGFDMAEGTLVRWVIGEGQSVTKDSVLAEIETDKATVEVQSSFSGVVFKQLVQQGTIVPVGKPIAVISKEGEVVDPSFWQSSDAKAAPDTGDTVDANPQKEPLSQAKSGPGEIIESSAGVNKAESSAMQNEPETTGEIKASPLAKRIARDQKVDLTFVKGSGPEGRIVRKDVESVLKTSSQFTGDKGGKQVPAYVSTSGSIEPVWIPIQIPSDERIPLNRLRAAIGRRMVESKLHVPHFYITRDYCLDALLDIRAQWNEIVSEDRKLSINDFVVKATALTLRQFPNLNSSLNGEEIIRHGHIHIGVAVAVSGGLLTVVCRDADQKTLPSLSADIREMATRARTGKVRTDDIEGSTFSISNLGMFDVESFAAIINPPEVAILAVSSAREEAVVRDGQVAICRQMKITISADHRVTDGAEAAGFMQLLGKYLEKPLGLLTST
jgi:pyruvate dehydrogenase E2 component (dihydrolipoamide acetyltransferase)